MSMTSKQQSELAIAPSAIPAAFLSTSSKLIEKTEQPNTCQSVQILAGKSNETVPAD